MNRAILLVLSIVFYCYAAHAEKFDLTHALEAFAQFGDFAKGLLFLLPHILLAVTEGYQEQGAGASQFPNLAPHEDLSNFYNPQ